MMHDYDKNSAGGNDRHPESEINPGVARVGAIFAIAFLLAAQLPPPVDHLALRDFLVTAAMATAMWAGVSRERLLRDSFTLWDEAAVLALIGFGVGAAIDPGAVEAYLAEIGAVTVPTEGGAR